MSEAMKAMRDFLTKSPSVVFPNEVMELFIPIEKENIKLRKLVQDLWFALLYSGMTPSGATGKGFASRMCELGIEMK